MRERGWNPLDTSRPGGSGCWGRRGLWQEVRPWETCHLGRACAICSGICRPGVVPANYLGVKGRASRRAWEPPPPTQPSSGLRKSKRAHVGVGTEHLSTNSWSRPRLHPGARLSLSRSPLGLGVSPGPPRLGEAGAQPSRGPEDTVCVWVGGCGGWPVPRSGSSSAGRSHPAPPASGPLAPHPHSCHPRSCRGRLGPVGSAHSWPASGPRAEGPKGPRGGLSSREGGGDLGASSPRGAPEGRGGQGHWAGSGVGLGPGVVSLGRRARTCGAGGPSSPPPARVTHVPLTEETGFGERKAPRGSRGSSPRDTAPGARFSASRTPRCAPSSPACLRSPRSGSPHAPRRPAGGDPAHVRSGRRSQTPAAAPRGRCPAAPAPLRSRPGAPEPVSARRRARGGAGGGA